MRQVSTDTQPQVSGALFFPVSARKLIVMSVATLGLYETYWFYKNWKAVQERTGKEMSPFWRGVFGPWWCFSLFKAVEACAAAHRVKLWFAPGWAAGVYFGLRACGRLPSPYWLLTFLALIPLVLVQRTCNDLNRTVAPEYATNDRFSALNVAGILLGAGLLIFPLVRSFNLDWVRAAGTFFPVDLSHHVNYGLTQPMLGVAGNNLSDLGTGHTTLRWVPFQIDGAVLVGPGETQGRLTGGPVPLSASVTGIPIGRKLDWLYFLHAANFASLNSCLGPGEKIGAYIVHYADGTQEQIPLCTGVDIADWWDVRDQVSAAEVAWTGKNDAASANRVGIRLFLKSWKNPRPGVAIQSLDVVAADRIVPLGHSAPAPFLVAVTSELGPGG